EYHLVIAFACASFASSTRQRDSNAKIAKGRGDAIPPQEVCLVDALISVPLSLNSFCSDQKTNEMNKRGTMDTLKLNSAQIQVAIDQLTTQPDGLNNSRQALY
ncbi:MAG: hypothetical protein ACTH5B_16275, partial [Marinomonas sp.]|uniref:hypothetical protein n=1 Tax=Marinomonas sp. TaxID=1904862 RepID=UPI003F9A211B